MTRLAAPSNAAAKTRMCHDWWSKNALTASEGLDEAAGLHRRPGWNDRRVLHSCS